MATLRKQIIDACVTALNTGRPTGIPAASRIRQDQFEASTTPSISVYPGDETIEPATNRVSPVVKRSLQVVVEVRIAGNNPDALLDPAVAWVEKTMSALSSPLVHDVREVSVTQEFAIGTEPLGLARCSFVVSYQTRRTDPEAAD